MTKYRTDWLWNSPDGPKAQIGALVSKPVALREYNRCKRDDRTIETRLETDTGTVLKIFRNGRESFATRRKITDRDGREKWVWRIWE